MKKLHLPAGLLLLLLVAARFAAAQPLPAGVITYEGTRKIDPSQVKIFRNGDVVQAGGPEAPELPDAVTFAHTLTFAGPYAREEQENAGPVIRQFGAGPNQGVPLSPPFTEKNYLDLTARKRIEVLELKGDSSQGRFRTEHAVAPPTDWQEMGNTRRIAGYTCHKATCTWKGETYTLWYTRELGFAYSPIAALTPKNGVVLHVEGSREGFTATRVEKKAVEEEGLRPPPDARPVTPAELNELRQKAQADFRQRLFSAPPPGN